MFGRNRITVIGVTCFIFLSEQNFKIAVRLTCTPKPTPTPRPTTPPNPKHPLSAPMTPSKGGQRKRVRVSTRTNVSQEACCHYYHILLSRPKAEVEHIWNLTPSQYVEFREAINAQLYKKMADWERKKKPVSFNPTLAGIKSERGKSPERSPSPTNTPVVKGKGKETENAYERNIKHPIPMVDSNKLTIRDPTEVLSLNFTIESTDMAGFIESIPLKAEAAKTFGELRKYLADEIKRNNFILLYKGRRLGWKVRIGERLRDGNVCQIIEAWNTVDPTIANYPKRCKKKLQHMT